MKRRNVGFNEDLIDCINYILKEQEKIMWISNEIFKKKWGKGRGTELHTFLSYNQALDTNGNKIRIIIPEGIRLREEAQLRIISKEQSKILEKQTYIQNRQFWANIILVIIAVLALFVGYKTFKTQENIPELVLLTNQENNFINLAKRTDPFNHYLIYVYNKGKAPCVDLKINNIRYAKKIDRIITAKSNNPINEFLGVEQNYHILINRACSFNINNNETFCNPYLGAIKPNEIITIGIDADIGTFEKHHGNIGKKITFSIEAACLGSSDSKTITMTLDTSKP